MASAEDIRWMRAALALGARGLGRTWPNPSVGCVIVQGSRLVGRGFTALHGRPHAEPQALAMAGPQARGATAYVTLEPCAHHGVTPPCAQALIDAQVARVVIACADPDPRVNGGGTAMLRAAGIAVTTGVMEAQARRQQSGFLSRILRGRPHLTLKLATTMDGRIATRTGDSQWITGAPARAHVHAQRARHDAVMIGGGTARADNPQLTVRGHGPVPQPVRVVVSATLDLPSDSALMAGVADAPVWLCHGAQSPARPDLAQATLVPCATLATGRLDVTDVLAQLGTRGLTRVYCEGGGALAASLIGADLVDEVHLYTAGCLLGGDATAGLAPMAINALSDAPRFMLDDVRTIGGDVLQIWRPR